MDGMEITVKFNAVNDAEAVKILRQLADEFESEEALDFQAGEGGLVLRDHEKVGTWSAEADD